MTSEAFNLGLTIAAGTIFVLTLFNEWLRSKLWISGPLVCLLVGLLIGPMGLDFFAVDVAGNEAHRLFFEQTARITVSLSVMSAALRLPEGWILRHGRSVAIVLLGGMAVMWAGATVSSLFLGTGFLTALLIGAVITPTDPVLAGGIVQGGTAEANIAADIRHGLTVESGANDGLGLPFVLLPILLMEGTSGSLFEEWGLRVILWEVIGAALFGIAAGWVAGTLYVWSDHRGATSKKMLTAVTLSLTLLVLAGTRLMQADGILAVFAAGAAFDHKLEDEHSKRAEHFKEAVDRFFTLPVFILLGVSAPFAAWQEMGWPLLAFIGAAMVIRRPVPFLALWKAIPLIRDRRTAVFFGWFGPIGVAALFYALLALGRTGEAVVWNAVTALVTASIVIHGVTATPLTKVYGRPASAGRPAGDQALR